MAPCTDDSSRKSTDVSIDRLNNLPEPIICHILSFLPTRDAVKTTLISLIFIELWKNINTLRFSHHANKGENLRNFINFVNVVFSGLETTCIDEFSIELSGDDSLFELRSWVSAAVAKKVKRLVLLNCCGVKHRFHIQLPECIFTCKSLEVIELRHIHINVMMNPSSSICFPNLRILRLEGVRFHDDDQLNKLISLCSSLHTLYLRHRRQRRQAGYDFKRLSVCSPTLERLTIIISSDNYTELCDWMLKIDTPALRYLHRKQTMFMNLSIQTSSPLIEAEVSLGVAIFDLRTVDNFIGALSSVKFLDLDVSDNWLEPNRYSIVWPLFSNLTSLTLMNLSDQFDIVKDLLQKLPILETLDLKCTYSRGCNSLEESNIIPGYISPFLAMVKIDNFYGIIGQLKVLEYILLNASLLKRVKIITDRNSRRKIESFEEISRLSRKSKNCRIEFD